MKEFHFPLPSIKASQREEITFHIYILIKHYAKTGYQLINHTIITSIPLERISRFPRYDTIRYETVRRYRLWIVDCPLSIVPIYLSTYLPIFLSSYLSIYLHIYISYLLTPFTHIINSSLSPPPPPPPLPRQLGNDPACLH